MPDEPTAGDGPSRRRVLQAATLGSAGIAVSGAGLAVAASRGRHDVPGARPAADTRPAADASARAVADVVAFDGAHQAGITTPAQPHAVVAALDLTVVGRRRLRALLADWTVAARRMSAGRPVGAVDPAAAVPPADNGDALGLPAARLTVTFGAGPALFDRRFGLADARPSRLVELPAFRNDRLDPAWCGGDVCLQVCADDAQVAVHALRTLLHVAGHRARLRWSQQGFLSRAAGAAMPRNLLGFADGTASIAGTDTAALHEQVWVGAEGPGWMAGGSYLVVRRIALDLEAWDRSSIGEQERTIGRRKVSGDRLARPPASAHARLAGPASNGGVRLLRRGYSYAATAHHGAWDAGLLFLAYQRDVQQQFVAIQSRLAARDALNEYLTHVGSAVFAVVPGVASGEIWGQRLFEA